MLVRESFWFGSPVNDVAWYGSVFVFIAVEFVVLRTMPSARRRGVSPEGVRVDIGIRTISYPWSELTQVVRTNQKRYPPQGDIQPISRTRIVFGRSFFVNEFTLSSAQGDLLARYLYLG